MEEGKYGRIDQRKWDSHASAAMHGRASRLFLIPKAIPGHAPPSGKPGNFAKDSACRIMVFDVVPKTDA